MRNIFIICLLLTNIHYVSKTDEMPDNFIGLGLNIGKHSSVFDYRDFSHDKLNVKSWGNLKNLNFNYKHLLFEEFFFGIGFYYQILEADYHNFNFETIGIGGEIFQGQFDKELNLRNETYNLRFSCDKFIYPNVILSAGISSSIFSNLNINYKEKIIYPIDRGVFLENNQRSRNHKSFSIDDYFQIVGDIGFKYFVKGNSSSTFFLVPEINYKYQINNYNKFNDYFGEIAIGISFHYALSGKLLFNSNNEKHIIPTDFNVSITPTGINNNIEKYLDSVIVRENDDNHPLICNISTLNFNILYDNAKEIKTWKLLLFSDKNEFYKEFVGESAIPSFISWSLNQDENFNQTLIHFSYLSSFYPSKFSFDLNFQIQILDKNDQLYISQIYKLKFVK